MTTQEILQGVHEWTNGKIVYDISATHPDGQGNPTKYADLAAALGTNGANVPEGIRKGGMSVKFVQSSDNKYVRYALNATSFTTTPSAWELENDTLPNMQETVVSVIGRKEEEIINLNDVDVRNYFINAKQGNKWQNGGEHYFFPVMVGEKVSVKAGAGVYTVLAFLSSDSLSPGETAPIIGNTISGYDGSIETVIAPEGTQYCYISKTISGQDRTPQYVKFLANIKVDNTPQDDSPNLISSNAVYQLTDKFDYYAECETAANVQQKSIVLPEYFQFVNGATIRVKFKYAHSLNSAALLHCEGVFTKPILYNGDNVIASNSWDAGEIITFIYSVNSNAFIAYSLDNTKANLGLLYNSNYAYPIQFNTSAKTCAIKATSRVVINSKIIVLPNEDVVLELTNNGTPIYAGIICYDFISKAFCVIPHDNSAFKPKYIIIADFSFYGNEYKVNSPSSFSIDNKPFGIDLSTQVTSIVSPEFELIQLPSEVEWWSDFIFITINGVEELWIFKASGNETHTTANGKIYRVRVSDWSYIGSISHDFGHCNTVHYDKYHDNLLIGNLPGNETYPAALYIFYNISSWVTESTIRFDDLNPSIIDVTSQYVGEISAFWAEGYNRRNQVYVMNSYSNPPKVMKIVLGMGTNELTYGTYDSNHTADTQFNGTYDLVFEPITYKLSSGVANVNVCQGGDFAKGRIITANGHDEIYGFIFDINQKDGQIHQIMINSVPRKADGTIDCSVGEGLAVKDDFVYHGYIHYGSGNFYDGGTVEGYYLAKYRMP